MKFLKRGAVASLLAVGCGMAAPAQAADNQIDCAILICLAGGWPASTECSAAHAEFIRRITPWPVEPPLQIWRCPLRVSHNSKGGADALPRLFQITTEIRRDLKYSPAVQVSPSSLTAEFRGNRAFPATKLLWLVGDYSAKNGMADIDISGSEYDFVRSIRVYNVEYARQDESGRDQDCNRSQHVRLGTYGQQGGFSWHPSSVEALPDAYKGVDGWGESCPNVHSRAVFVEWTDYEGNYGYEQVNY